MEAQVRRRLEYHNARGSLLAPLASGGFSFCVASVRSYGRTDRGDIYPAELSICRATISEGVLDEYVCHRIMKCDAIPHGFRATFTDNVNITHKIPLNFPGDDDWDEIVSDINIITRASETDDDELPILAHPAVGKDVTDFFKWLWRRSSSVSRYPRVFSLYTFAKLIFGELPARLNFNPDQLFKASSGYSHGLGCKWHEIHMPEGLDECARFQVRKQIGVMNAYHREMSGFF